MPNPLSKTEREELRRIYDRVAETMPIAPFLTISRLLDTIDELEERLKNEREAKDTYYQYKIRQREGGS